MFDQMIRDLKTLSKTEIQISAVGQYPTKARTPVQDVAHYQNDGTDKGIKPARFVEAAERKARFWENPIDKSIRRFLFGRRQGEMKIAFGAIAVKIAEDINRAVNRIRTGRLQTSMRAKFLIGH